ncbi:hypothetical protein ACFZCU_21865 [Streptomyces canus]|uniref:hypothetical protein n=1 Tax=Streptomyces canus TaxID=58343 RepID=UPI0036EA0B14
MSAGGGHRAPGLDEAGQAGGGSLRPIPQPAAPTVWLDLSGLSFIATAQGSTVHSEPLPDGVLLTGG